MRDLLKKHFKTTWVDWHLDQYYQCASALCSWLSPME